MFQRRFVDRLAALTIQAHHSRIQNFARADWGRRMTEQNEIAEAASDTQRYITIFEQLEREYDVCEWRCGGVRIWPLVKFVLAQEMFDYVKEKNLVHFRRNFHVGRKLSFVSQVLATDLADRVLSPLRQADICLFIYDTLRHYRVGERWFSIFQDPLLHFCQELGLQLSTLELVNAYPPRSPRLHRSHSLTFSLAAAKVLSRSPLLGWRLRADIDRVLERIDACRHVLGVTDIEPLKREIAAAILFLFAAAEIFERSLRVIRPRLTLMCNYYSITGLAFCLASHRLGIRSADISHGASGHYHYAYGGWSPAPPGGYELLPYDFLTRTEEDAAALSSLYEGYPDRRAPVVVGDLAGHAWRENAFGVAESARQTLEQVRPRRAGTGGRLEVLIAVQSPDGLPSVYLEVMQRVGDWCFFWVRIHPGYIGDLAIAALPVPADSYNMIQATAQPLFALLERADVVMTETSSVAEDARTRGIPSIITHDVGRFMYRDHIQAGRMLTGSSADEIVASLKRIREASSPRPTAFSKEEFELQRARLKAYLAANAAGYAHDGRISNR